MKHLLILASFIALAACGSKTKNDPADPCKADPCAGTKEPARTFDGPLQPGEWESLSHEDQEAFMEQVVEPAMRAEFQKFDGTGFAEFGCGTCHGQGAMDDSFEMPNPGLPALGPATFQNPPEEDKPMIEFMGTVVKPKMAQLLGVPEKTPEQEGFACTNCHTWSE